MRMLMDRDKNGVCDYEPYHEGAKYCSACGWKRDEK